MATPRPPSLYAIADENTFGPSTLEALVRLADNGIEWIQLRAKKVTDRRFCELLEGACEALAQWPEVKLWVNDRPDLATLFPVAGVHLGQTDCPPEKVRSILPRDRWIGQSTHDLEQLRSADTNTAVDVVALGPIFTTTSKDHPDPVVGLDLLRSARRETEKPLLAIGGINQRNAAAVLAAGADAVVVLSALGPLSELDRRCEKLQSIVARTREKTRKAPEQEGTR